MNEQTVVSLENIKVACKNCSLSQLCLPMGLAPEDVERLDEIVLQTLAKEPALRFQRVSDLIGLRGRRAQRASGQIPILRSPELDLFPCCQGFRLSRSRRCRLSVNSLKVRGLP